MTTYLNDKEIIVVNDEKLKYKVVSYETYHSRNYAVINLELIAGWDYLDENSEVQGWCSADRFIEEVQHEWATWSFIHESMTEALESIGYQIVRKKDI